MSAGIRLRKLRSFIDEERGKEIQIRQDIERAEVDLEAGLDDLENSKKAQDVINIVAEDAQKDLENKLSDLVSMAMAGVFPDPYVLEVNFIPRRGKVEVDLFYAKNDKLISPMDSAEGGAIDLGALAIRFSCWAIVRGGRTRPIMILDEPLKWLKGDDLPRKGAQIIKEISKKLGLQVIMVSHDPELVDYADNIISLSLKDGKSRITGHKLKSL